MDNQIPVVNAEDVPGYASDGLIEDTHNEQMTLFTLQEMAITNTNSLSALKEDLKTTKEMLDSVLESHDLYIEERDKVKEAKNRLKAEEQQIAQRPDVVSLSNKIKEIKETIKEKKDTISDVAFEVFRKSGRTEFESNGERYQIQTVAKIVKI